MRCPDAPRVCKAGVFVAALLATASHADPSFVVSESPGSTPEFLTVAGSTIFFSADDGLSGKELWKLDQNGTFSMVTDLYPGPKGSEPRKFQAVGGNIYFFANNLDASVRVLPQLYTSDGTLDGTQKLSDLSVGLDVRHFVATDWALIANAKTRRFGHELWAAVRNPSEKGGWGPFDQVRNFKVASDDGMNLGPFVVHNRIVIFAAFYDDPEFQRSVVWIWRPDADGPIPLRDENGDVIICEGDIEGVSTGNRLFLVSRGERFDLWIGNADLSSVRPILEADHAIPPPSQLFAWGDDLYFQYRGSGIGDELFSINENTRAAKRIADINPGGNSSRPHKLREVNGRLIFNATREDSGIELWSWTPGHDQAVLLTDFNPGPIDSDPFAQFVFDNRLFFSAKHRDFGEEPWITDGTPEGTQLIKDMTPGNNGSSPYHPVEFFGNLYFTAYTPDTGEEIWRLTSHDSSPTLATQIRPALLSVQSSSIEAVVATQYGAYFVATTPEYGCEIWESDGTQQGTKLLFDLVPGPKGSHPADLSLDPREQALCFAALNHDGVRVAWRYTIGPKELTQTSTLEAVDKPDNVRPQLWNADDVLKLDAPSLPLEGGKIGELNVFALWSQELGRELWALRDHDHDPYLLKDIYPGPASGNPRDMVSTGRYVVFRAEGPGGRASVWITDGTSQETKSVGVGVPESAVMWENGVAMIIRTDDGRRRLMSYSPETGLLAPYLTDWEEKTLQIHCLAASANRLYFAGTHPSFGEELWSATGVGPETTRMVCDLTPNRVAKTTPLAD